MKHFGCAMLQEQKAGDNTQHAMNLRGVLVQEIHKSPPTYVLLLSGNYSGASQSRAGVQTAKIV